MSTLSSHEITDLLVAWREGDQAALEKLVPIVYQELRRLAHRFMAGQSPDHTLQTTALVSEAYVRLLGCQKVHWNDRIHFFAVSAQLMRRILVECARSSQSQKRGGGAQNVNFDEVLIFPQKPGQDLVALDDALNAFAAVYPRKGRVVELRFFGGLSVEETAQVLDVSAVTVLRDWRMAKAWLSRELKKGRQHDA